MDSTRTNLLEKQPSEAEVPKNNTFKLYILSLVILLSLVTAGILFITSVINLSESDPISSIQIVELAPTTGHSIRAICSFAPYKRLCRNTLSSSISTNISSDNLALSLDCVFPPENIILCSFQLGVSQLTSLTNISKLNHIPQLQECQVLLDKEMSGLTNSVASIQDLDLFRQEVSEYLDRFKRIETHQQVCLDKLQKSGSPKIDEIRLNLQKMRRYMSNSRAVLLNIDPIVEKIYNSSTSSSVQVHHNSIHSHAHFFHGVGYDYMIIFLLQYILLLCILISILKL
ncbi:hypothetical protein POM88_038988 [Heracleum sosnowskyi]|uniref:Pectinesterase inhibitor domain-containing protein n=1 Tax=Heracleum sosnowskyi TaxID=360622 RepID=A0AAD8H941_9APIA|nr:hypothetical protein POM88_038988 [Heracleum sosnowskyi]